MEHEPTLIVLTVESRCAEKVVGRLTGGIIKGTVVQGICLEKKSEENGRVVLRTSLKALNQVARKFSYKLILESTNRQVILVSVQKSS